MTRKIQSGNIEISFEDGGDKDWSHPLLHFAICFAKPVISIIQFASSLHPYGMRVISENTIENILVSNDDERFRDF